MVDNRCVGTQARPKQISKILRDNGILKQCENALTNPVECLEYEQTDRQMVDFLGTWKSPGASARYFRGNPRAVLLIVRKFYLSSVPTREERQGVARGS